MVRRIRAGRRLKVRFGYPVIFFFLEKYPEEARAARSISEIVLDGMRERDRAIKKMEKIPIILTSNPEDDPADFVAYLPVPLDLKGRWNCKLDCIHTATIQPAKTRPHNILTPFLVCFDFVEESQAIDRLIPVVGMFASGDWKSNYASEVYKKCHITFDGQSYPVTKSYLNRVRITILDRTLNVPTVSGSKLFRHVTTVKFTLLRDG